MAQQAAAGTADDPAIGAVRRWVAARERETSYLTPQGQDWDDDPQAVAISDECLSSYETEPTTDGLNSHGAPFRSRRLLVRLPVRGPGVWGDGVDCMQARNTILNSPIARKLFGIAQTA